MKNREIKFRAWYKTTKMMMSEFGVGEDEVGINKTLKAYEGDENWVIMQFTSLKDKNGVEIYEGDIVEFSKYHKRSEISYQEGGFAFKTNAGPSFVRLSKFCEDFEVIGNVYQNPELLK